MPPVESGLTRIHSPGSRTGYLLAGLAGLLVPAALFVCLSAVSLLTVGIEAGNDGAESPMPWWAAILALLLFIPLHELGHAILHPGFGLSPQTTVVLWPAKLRFGVYYEGCMSRRRWLIMRLAPLACLTVIPVLLLTVFSVTPAWFALEIFLQVLVLVNGIGSGGDVVAAIWVLFQVPAGAEICFRSGKAYWR